MYQVDYGFEATEDSHLDLDPGSIVEVVEKLDSGWWRGYAGDDEGWFPATYVHTLQRDESSPSPEPPAVVNQAFTEEDKEKPDKSPEKTVIITDHFRKRSSVFCRQLVQLLKCSRTPQTVTVICFVRSHCQTLQF